MPDHPTPPPLPPDAHPPSHPAPGFGPIPPAPGDRGRQAARASLYAPLVALALGCLTNVSRTKDPLTGRVIAWANVLILAAGFLFGVYALVGMRKWGRRGVLVPATFGILIFLLIAATQVAVFRAARQFAQRSAREAREAELSRIEQQGRDAFFEPGWMGAVHLDQTLITIVTIPDPHPLAQDFLRELTEPASLAILSVENSGSGREHTVDTGQAGLHFSDGQLRPAPSAVRLLSTMRKDQAQALAQFAPPFRVPARGQLSGKPLFIPRGIDLSKLAAITLTVDGADIEVPGRLYTTDEKRQLARQARSGPARPQ